MIDSTELIRELVAIPGPPGEEQAVGAAVGEWVRQIGFDTETDAKGNLIVRLRGDSSEPRILVTAHLDEIALMVTAREQDGRLRVAPMGGAYPWKWGELPVEILAREKTTPGVLCFGSIHTNSRDSVAQQAREAPLIWEQARVFTGLSAAELERLGVRPGTRVVVGRERRVVSEIGPYLCSYFLDDRADLAVMLLVLEELAGKEGQGGILFAATTSEEVGGEGASYIMQRYRPDVCVALEIGPSVPESSFMPDAQPTIWVTDNYSSMRSADASLLAEICAELGQRPHWQPLSRGGSDASAAAQRGLTARPITLGLPVENSHGFEIMHRDAPRELARLAGAFLRREM